MSRSRRSFAACARIEAFAWGAALTRSRITHRAHRAVGDAQKKGAGVPGPFRVRPIGDAIVQQTQT